MLSKKSEEKQVYPMFDPISFSPTSNIMSDSTTIERIELIAKEAYQCHCDFYNPKSWSTWPSWHQLGEATKGHWILQTRIIYDKMRYVDENNSIE
jgi:hypothetical protein